MTPMLVGSIVVLIGAAIAARAVQRRQQPARVPVLARSRALRRKARR